MNYFKRLAGIAAPVLLLGRGLTGAAEPLSAQVTQYGIYYRTGAMEVLRQKPAVGVTNVPLVRATLQFQRKTEYITAKRGLTFGFTYKLVNPPTAGDVPLETRITHPEFVLPSGQKLSTTRTRIIIHAADVSREFHVAYTFDEQFELVPGEWRLSLFHNGEELASKTFNVERDGGH